MASESAGREPVEVPVDLVDADSSDVLFFLAGQVPVSVSELAEQCQQNQAGVRDILDRRFQNEVQIDQTDFVRLTDAARSAILTEINPILTEATERQKHGQAAFDTEDYEKASEQYRAAAKLFSLAEERLSTVGDVPDKLTGRAETVREKHDRIQKEIAKDTLAHRKLLAEQREEAGDEAVQAGEYEDAVQAYQGALDAFDEAKEAIEAYNERRLSSESTALDPSKLDRLLEALKRKRQNANSRATEGSHSTASRSETKASDTDELSTSSSTGSGATVDDAGGDTVTVEGRQALLDDLRNVADTVGIPPSVGEVDEHGAVEPDVYLDEFGTWADALAAADLRTAEQGTGTADGGDTGNAVNSESGNDQEQTTEAETDTSTRPPTRENVIEEIRRQRDAYGRVPKMSEVVEATPWNRRTVWTNFDSWDEAIEAAGIDKRAELVELLNDVIDRLGREPTSSEMDDYGAFSSSVYYSEFGSWEAALDAATETSATDDEAHPPTKENIADEIRHKRGELGRLPRMKEFVNSAPWEKSEVLSEFESWNSALEAADIDQEAQLIDALQDVADNVGHKPTPEEVKKHSPFRSDMYTDVFGTWSDSIAAAGLETDEEGQISAKTETETGSNERPVDFAAFDDLTPNKRSSAELAIKLEETAYAGSKRDAAFDISDHTGETIRFNFWSKHDLDYPTETGVWYVVNEVRLQQWESDGETNRNLSSTRDTTYRRLDGKQQAEAASGVTQQANEQSTDDSETRDTTDQQETTNTESGDSASAAGDTTDEKDREIPSDSLLGSIEEEFDDDIV